MIYILTFAPIQSLPESAPINLLLAAAGALLAISILLLARKTTKNFFKKTRAFKRKVFLVMVPKERKQDTVSSQNDSESIEKIREEISVMENFFAAIGGLKAERGLIPFFTGRDDHISAEIVNQNGQISFYFSMPPKYIDYVEQELHAHFPHAQIQGIEDYNIFHPNSAIMGGRMTFKRKSAFPIKTYKKIENDTLLGITDALAKIAQGDSAAVQFFFRSAKRNWRRKLIEISREIQQGKKFEKVADQNAFLKILSGMGQIAKAAFQTKEKDNFRQNQEPYKLSPLEEELVKSMEEKASKAGMDCNINIVVCAKTQNAARGHLQNIINAFSQFNSYHFGNSFFAVVPRKPGKLIEQFIFREFNESRSFVVNTEEAASIFHLPLPNTETPGIKWLGARKAPPPVNLPKEGITLGIAEYRGRAYEVKIKKNDRRRHLYVIGKSGSGKTVLIQGMAIQDIQNGEGVCVIDPHGEFAEYVLEHVPAGRIDDVIYFNPSDTEMPMGLNMLEAKTEDQKDFVVQEMVSIFYKLFPPEMIGPMFEHNMRNVMLTLMADPSNPGTIAEIPRMFSDEEYASGWIDKVTDPVVRAFWEKEMAKTSDFHKSEMLGYLISKIGRFVENEMMRNIIGQTKSCFDFREVMDKKKILIVNLSKGTTGEVNAFLLGLIIVTKLQMAALGRTDIPEEGRHDFYLYIDEFQNFITDSIATILSEARKYRLNLIIAHQYMGQLIDKGETKIRDAVLGNVGTMASFRIGPEDAEMLQKEFAPVFGAYDLMNVEQHTAYIKLLIDNTAAKPFNFKPLPPTKGSAELAKQIKELSRLKYGRPREIVSVEILQRSKLGEAETESNTSFIESSK